MNALRIVLTACVLAAGVLHTGAATESRAEVSDGGKSFVVTDADFAAQVEQSRLPVVVLFWAPWCGPCRQVAPAVEDLARHYSGRIRFATLDIDANPSTAMRFGVNSIPTILIFRDGKVIERIVGALPADQLTARIDLQIPVHLTASS